MKRQRSTAELEAPGPVKKGAQAPTEAVQQKPADETQQKPAGNPQTPAEEAQKEEEEPPLSQGSSLSATTLPWGPGEADETAWRAGETA